MQPLDLTDLKTYPLASRPSKVMVGDLGRPVGPETPIGDWIETLPKQFGAVELRKLRDHVVRCRKAGHTIAAAIGNASSRRRSAA